MQVPWFFYQVFMHCTRLKNPLGSQIWGGGGGGGGGGGIWKHTCHACICMLNTQDSCYNQRLLKTITSHFCHCACATHRHIQNLVHFYKFKKDNVFSPLARSSDIVAWQLKAHLLIFQFGRSFWRPPEPKEKKINSAEL